MFELPFRADSTRFRTLGLSGHGDDLVGMLLFSGGLGLISRPQKFAAKIDPSRPADTRRRGEELLYRRRAKSMRPYRLADGVGTSNYRRSLQYKNLREREPRYQRQVSERADVGGTERMRHELPFARAANRIESAPSASQRDDSIDHHSLRSLGRPALADGYFTPNRANMIPPDMAVPKTPAKFGPIA